MKILIVNAGSSSLKYQLFSMANEETMAKGLIERIGIPGSRLKQKANGKEFIFETPMKDHIDASEQMLKALTDKEHGVISGMEEISAIGHRVVHGGENFTQSAIIDDDCLKAIQENSSFAPLHNPANLMGIKACRMVMPSTPMVAVFDTSFHQTMPPKAYLYGLPYAYYQNLKVRRYGFHGTSHRYVSERAAAFLNRPLSDLKIITCHLGNGSSVTAVDRGRSVDTSMGMTPLEGVLMGTRSGNLDPATLPYIMEHEGLDIRQLMEILNKKSGLLGVSGVSSDMRDVEVAAEQGNSLAKIALEMLDYTIIKYIGAYAAVMKGVDAIVFTGGIGENSPELREGVMAGMDFLGARLDPSKNKVKGKEVDLSAEGSRVRILVIPTNEELVIARDTKALIEKRS